MQKRISCAPSTSPGFTLIELLVVIVIIGILAAISIVTYGGVQNRAVATSLQSDLTNASDQLVIDQAHSNTGVFPATLDDAGDVIKWSDGTIPTYVVNNANTPKTFCLTATKSNQSYFITQEGLPMPGPCPILYFDAGISTSYTGSGTVLTDLSGNGRNGTLSPTVSYLNTKNGVLSFNGVDGYVNFPVTTINLTYFTASAWIYITGDGSSGINGVMNGKAFRFFINNSNNYMRTQINGVTPFDSTASTAVTRSQWVNVAFSYDGTNRNYYLNGVLVAQIPSTGSPTNLNNGQVGAIQSSGYAFNGQIGLATIYDSAISSTDIKKSFDFFRGRFGV